MSRDISVSKAQNTLAFENHNIRIEARDHDTLLSVTNERGNKEVESCTFSGELLGYNILNEYIIIFTTEEWNENQRNIDRIYRVRYEEGEFTSKLLFQGTLGFDLEHPIESIVSYETPTIQKIYWIDGKHVMRFMNFVDKRYDSTLYDMKEMLDQKGINTTFDVNRGASFSINVDIVKGNNGQNRPNGVAQYIVTYYNKNGNQTSYIYISDIIYLAPEGRGGSADGFNNNSVNITLSNLDPSFDYVRVYSIIRTSYNGTPSAYIVGDASVVKDKSVSIVDNGSHLEAFDYSELLFLGSRPVVAGTITHKDGTMFLGDLKSIGNTGINELEDAIRNNAFKLNGDPKFVYGEHWESDIVDFVLTDKEEDDIPYIIPSGLYPYESQLKSSSSRITTFKGGEKYRFALRFRRNDGTESDAMWIGDKVNTFYPMIDYSDGKSKIHRAVAVCNLSKKNDIIIAARKCGFDSVTLCIAKADYSDRSVLAQGVVCPTVFNNMFRCNNAPFLQPSWIFRPRKSNITNRHYSVLKKSNSPYGEIQCNWWNDTSSVPTPYYYIDKDTKDIYNKPEGIDDFSKFKFVVAVKCDGKLSILRQWWGEVWIAKYVGDATNPSEDGTKEIEGNVVLSKFYIGGNGFNNFAKEYLKTKIKEEFLDKLINVDIDDVWDSIVKSANDKSSATKAGYTFYNGSTISNEYKSIEESMRAVSWESRIAISGMSSDVFARYTRNLFFVDEHAVTLNSPEIQYEKVNVDNNTKLKFRIVGVSKITGNISDYSIDYTNGHMSGEHVNDINFSKQNISNRPDGIVSWPLFMESSMFLDHTKADIPEESRRTYKDYLFGSGISSYMMNMWHHSGSIPEYYDDNQNGYSVLDRKIVANLRYSYYTLYNNYGDGFWIQDSLPSIRQFNAIDRQLMDIRYDGEVKEYSGTESQIVTMPGLNKYPVFFSNGTPMNGDSFSLDNYLMSQSPVPIEYRSEPHAVICFGNRDDGQVVLPKTPGMVEYNPDAGEAGQEDVETANIIGMSNADGPFVPWASTLSSAGFSIGYLNKGDDRSYPVELIGETAYMPFDNELLSGLKEAKSVAGRNSFYMLLNVNGQNKVAAIDKVYRDSFVVDSFVSDVLFVRSYIANGYTRINPLILNTRLVIDGNDVSMSDYSARLMVYKNGEWIDAEDVEITNEGNNPICAFRINVTYHHEVYGDVDFYTDSHMENIVEITDGTSDESDNPGDIMPQILDDEDHGGDFGDVEGGGSSDVDDDDNVNGGGNGGNAGTKDGYNRLENTRFEFVVVDRQYTEFGNAIKIHYVTLTAFDSTFINELKIADINSEFHDIYQLLEGNIVKLERADISLSFAVSPQDKFVLNRDDKKYLGPNDEYLFIGELYYDYDDPETVDERYGGIDENDIESNVFIDCSKPYEISESVVLTGNIGDTYFQRWDCVKTVPYSRNSVNGVIDIVSFMVETHINIEGRTDLDRGITNLASIDYDNFGSLNPVYSQENSFIQSMDTDSALNEDSYETSITWSLEKHDGQEIDPWTHITLASALTLDGDKGKCNALARFANTIIAFQDRGICEVMFNSRTQLSTENGVPVEIANSGKVDGKRYISNKYGCTNKWSITEGKGGLYFVDNINKIIGAFNGESITPLSSKFGFDAWVRRNNSIAPWSPVNTNAFRSFYDRIHSDVYFVNSMDENNPCLVYNEMLETFTSFFDYKDVPMMVNVCDRFISYKANRLYLQNEGDWCSIFGEQKPFWMKWRVQPEPYADKIWTNVEYRADFFDNPDTEDVSLSDSYMPYETFDKLVVETEYQKGEMSIDIHRYPGVEKKFRIWRLDIPRDMNSEFCMDRIRNPWAYITLAKEETEPNEMMNLNDMVVKYFSEE